MKIVGLQGLRGGVGTTSVLAMIADALHTAGQSVLMIDLNSSDMLRLHFNVPFTDTTGWACAQSLQQPWYSHNLELSRGLNLIPYGRFGLYQKPGHSPVALTPTQTDLRWLQELKQLQSPPDWVLLDLPHHGVFEEDFWTLLDQHIVVSCVDIACHVLLSQQALREGSKVLANMQDPTRQLSSDLIIEWQARFHAVLLPIVLNRDESMHEAMALKTPVTKAFPESRAASDAMALASWLQIHTKDAS